MTPEQRLNQAFELSEIEKQAELRELSRQFPDLDKKILDLYTNLSSASQRFEPLLDDLRKTSAQANKALDHVDSLIGDNRADIREAVKDLRASLATVNDLTGRLDQTLDVNSDNIDELLENLRHVSQNLKEFTNTIKTRPYTLIRANNPREHKPGERQ